MVKYVELGGKKRPVKFGFNALSEFGELTGRKMDELNRLNPSTFSLKDILLLCWCALKHGARLENQPFDASMEEVGDWFDDAPNAMPEMIGEYNKATSSDPKETKKKEVKKSP